MKDYRAQEGGMLPGVVNEGHMSLVSMEIKAVGDQGCVFIPYPGRAGLLL